MKRAVRRKNDEAKEANAGGGAAVHEKSLLVTRTAASGAGCHHIHAILDKTADPFLAGQRFCEDFFSEKQDNLNEIGFLSFSETTYCVAEGVQKREILYFYFLQTIASSQDHACLLFDIRRRTKVTSRKRKWLSTSSLWSKPSMVKQLSQQGSTFRLMLFHLPGSCSPTTNDIIFQLSP